MIRLTFTCLLVGMFCSAANGDEGLPSTRLTVATRRYGGSDLISIDVMSKEVTRLTKDMGDVNEPSW